MHKVLVIFAHPALHHSHTNIYLKEIALRVSGVSVHDLYEMYPDFYIDVAFEQKMLLETDVLVFMHPFYWYSAPSLLKEWQDVVLEKGFAYGPGGTRLRGKKLWSVISTGGPEFAYHPSGYNRYTMREFLIPFDQTANLCGMEYLEPCVLHGANIHDETSLKTHGARLDEKLKQLVAAGTLR